MKILVFWALQMFLFYILKRDNKALTNRCLIVSKLDTACFSMGNFNIIIMVLSLNIIHFGQGFLCNFFLVIVKCLMSVTFCQLFNVRFLMLNYFLYCWVLNLMIWAYFQAIFEKKFQVILIFGSFITSGYVSMYNIKFI